MTPLQERYGNKIRAIKSTYTPLEQNGETLTDPVDKANCLLQHFNISKVGKNIAIPQDFKHIINNTNREILEEEYNNINMHELENALSSLNNSSPGFDSIPNALIKELPYVTKVELLDIFNQSFNTGVIPQSWKLGTVIPILKPGKPKEITISYRLITLLSCLGKLLEHINQKRLEYIVDKEQLLLGA